MMGIERSELGGCRLIRKIGAGAMGEVYLAEQVSLGNRLVAVKVVHAEHEVSSPTGAAADAGWRFIREAQVLGRLTHPNILPVYHSGVEAGYRFLVMQYAPDGSLADAIKGQGAHRLDLPASLPFVVDVVAQVAGALQYTHEHQVIHADVKPSNVLVQVEPNGHWHVLLADFGVARSMDSIDLRNEVMGTAAYMAPERFYGQLSPAGDQYALGVMAFQLLAGRLPFGGGLVELARAHAREDPPTLCALNPAIRPAVEAVIVRALAKRPADRYPSVAAFAKALHAASTGADTTVVAARSRTAPAWAQQSTVPRAPRRAAASPARTYLRNGNARRRVAPGLAVLALLLVTCVASIGLHIDISRALSSHGGADQTPAAAGTDTSMRPTTSPGTVPTAQGSAVPASPTRTPTAQPTPQSSPEPTATPTGQPTATATATDIPQPTATATGLPKPTATATAQPTQPAATATAQPTAQPTAVPTPTPPAQPPNAAAMPVPARGAR